MKKRLFSLVLTLFCTSRLLAGLPVTDFTNIYQQLRHFIIEGQRFKEEYDKAAQTAGKITELQRQTSEYYQKLKEISAQVDKYYKIYEASAALVSLTNLYARTYPKFTSSSYLSIVEKKRFLGSYKQIINEAGKHLNSLKDVVTGGTYEMSDGERLEKVDLIHKNIIALRGTMIHLNRVVSSTISFRAQKASESRLMNDFLGHNWSL